MRARVGFLLSMIAAVFPAAVSAQSTVTVGVSALSTPSLGRVVPSPSTTTFTMNASTGAVTKSGNAVVLSSGAVAAQTITITCKAPCNGNNPPRTIDIDVSAGAVLGRTTITNFSYADLSGATALTSTTTGLPLTFRIQFAMGGNSNNDKVATFKLGMTASVPGSGATGNGSFGYTIRATRQ